MMPLALPILSFDLCTPYVCKDAFSVFLKFLYSFYIKASLFSKLGLGKFAWLKRMKGF
ncbi:hypothetical protein RchiOBHm_Chr7g0235021 [Rosa chinensis]|uniref:Uncharacterized protein n=1 Tax=Rosa chinensis TaxID=74649 RepID=A0A2P6PGK4_ROSCH|nr:hypothetical protein RchiOBHm_Chr7g0235021 [Rosa chinensis]